MEAVEAADTTQLARWSRFLGSPGQAHIGQAGVRRADYEAAIEREAAIMDRIQARFNELGGWNCTLSKVIGWEE